MRLTNDMRASIVSSVMADTKQVDYLEQACAKVKKMVLAKAPKVIAEAYKFDPSCFRHENVWRDHVHISVPQLFNGVREIAKLDAITPLIERHHAQEDARYKARTALSSLLSGCTTTEQVITVAPELEKYLPKDAPKKALPVATGLKDTLKAAGWPK